MTHLYRARDTPNLVLVIIESGVVINLCVPQRTTVTIPPVPKCKIVLSESCSLAPIPRPLYLLPASVRIPKALPVLVYL